MTMETVKEETVVVVTTNVAEEGSKRNGHIERGGKGSNRASHGETVVTGAAEAVMKVNPVRVASSTMG